MPQTRFDLNQTEMPRQWYNLAADLPNPPSPPLGPDGQPVKPEMLMPVFPANLIEQEVSTARWVDIPGEVLDLLARWRPTPLRRAVWLEQKLNTPARIYYKDESVSPAGSHKPNTAVAQAWFNKKFGIKRLCTETGAGQWGSALAFACKLVGLECKVFMVRVSYDQKPARRDLMQAWGATCVASPSSETQAGKSFLAKDPKHPGSLGIAISEALEAAVTDASGSSRYALGSVLNHVLLHQTVIGLEAKKQLALAGEEKPDLVVGAVGGGSNFAGLAFPFVADKIAGKKITIVPVEPLAAPSLTRGNFTYDHGDTARMTPLLPMHTLGHAFVPPSIHAGGLRYHGMAPLVSQAAVEGLLAPRAYGQNACFAAALTWAATEGSIPAPETSHAIAAVIEEAEKAKAEGNPKVILFNYSGHGMFDLGGYAQYLQGKLADSAMTDAELKTSLAAISGLPPAPVRRSGKW